VSFRFRIVLSDSPKPGAGQQRASQWFALIPAEVRESSALPKHTLEISRPVANFILSPDIRRLGKTVVIRWQSFAESFGWVELQAMAGISPQQTTTTPALEQTAGPGQEPHPLMVTTEFATIDLCYTCHPESGLGSSHPVRIYTQGKETLIPASLPTGKDGMLTCVTCHDPHGGENKALVRELIVTKLCVACHYTFKQTSRHTMF
jgi:predicted CXXCH cytochrome family protein